MSCYSRRNTLSLLAAPFLSACGFTPLYGPDGAARDIQGLVTIPTLPSRFGFDLREGLITRLGDPAQADFALSLQPALSQEGRGIQGDNTITRFNVEATVDFAVSRIGAEQPLFQDRARAFTAYSAVAGPFATRAAEDDALRRLADTLADQIALRLSATAGAWAQ
ncbi:MAG: LPS assembly lipoprotein LptE [Pseudomonadota bacterium]